MSIFNASQSLSATKWLNDEAAQIVVANIPVETPCEVCGGPDAYLGGGYDMTCPACNKGVVVTNVQSAFKARVQWMSGVGFQMFFNSVVASGDMGDALLQVPLQGKHILEEVRKSKGAYLFVDGKRIRPQDISTNRVDQVTTLIAICDVVKDDQ